MRSSAPEGQHAPRAKQAPPSGSSGAAAGPTGAQPTSPHSNSASSRPQASLSHKTSSPQSISQRSSGQVNTPNRVSSQSRNIAGHHPQQQRPQQKVGGSVHAPQLQQHQRSPTTPPTPQSLPQPLSSVVKQPQLQSPNKLAQTRLSQPHRTSPQSQTKPNSVGPQSRHSDQPSKQGSPKSSQSTANPPNFGEYDDQEWDVGVGHLIIDLDADIAQADRGRMSGAPSTTMVLQQGPHGTPISEDKHSLKMKIKRTKPPTKTSEAKHEIVKPDVVQINPQGNIGTNGATPNTPSQHNGAGVKIENNGTPRSSTVPRAVFKKEKRRLDVNGAPSSPPQNAPLRMVPHQSLSLPIATATLNNQPISQPATTTHYGTLAPITTPQIFTTTSSNSHSTPNSTVTPQMLTNPILTSHSNSNNMLGHQMQVKIEPRSPVPVGLTCNSVVSKPVVSQQQIKPCSSPILANQQVAEVQSDRLSPTNKKIKLNDDCAKKDACVGTSVGTITEPDCLGPCEPGSSVTLEGIVWHETEGGVLVVNVTWRGKTYVGTLLDCTKHDWAPPRYCDSPTSDLESRTPKGRAKRGRTAASSSNAATITNTPATELSVTETRSGKLRNATMKGRRGGGTPTFNPPPSPVKSETGGTKRKGRETECGPQPDPKSFKRSRSCSRSTPTNGCSSPSLEQQLINQSQAQNGASEPPNPPTSPQLIECPEPNCNKKYKHINGLKYHQSHAHTNSVLSNEDDVSTAEKSENSEVEETRHPSPTPVASTPVDAFSQDLIKPAVLRPTAVTLPPHPVKGDSNVTISQLQAHGVNSHLPNSPQHVYVYSNNSGKTSPHKPSTTVPSVISSNKTLQGVPQSSESSLQTQLPGPLQSSELNNLPQQISPEEFHPVAQNANHITQPNILSKKSHQIQQTIQGSSQQQLSAHVSQPSSTSHIHTQSLSVTQSQALQPNHNTHLMQCTPQNQLPSQLHHPSQLHIPSQVSLQSIPTTASLISTAQTHQMPTGGPTSHLSLPVNNNSLLPSSAQVNMQSQTHLPSQPYFSPQHQLSSFTPQILDSCPTSLPSQHNSPQNRLDVVSGLISGHGNSNILRNSTESSSPVQNVPSAIQLSVSNIPQGTPLSSLPGSSPLLGKDKSVVDGEKLLGKQKELVNGLSPKKEEESSREDARSPAYSDISDANDSTSVIDGESDSKDFKDEKKPELPLGAASHYAYGLYHHFGAYGQPHHPYIMPAIQPPPGLPMKPGDMKDPKDKFDKDKKEGGPHLGGGNEYMKFPPHYLYSYSHLYPPGYPDPYLREPMYKDLMDKPKFEQKEIQSADDSDKGPTDLSRSCPNNDKITLIQRENQLTLNPNKEPLDIRLQGTPEKRPHDSVQSYRYINSYDNRLSVGGASIEKSNEPKVSMSANKSVTPNPLSSPRLGSTPPVSNNKEDKSEKRNEVKSEGVKPTMETTGPPPPPTSSAYYQPFPYSHVTFDPYRPQLVPSLPAGFPPSYLHGPNLGLRYPMGIPSGPEDLSRSSSGGQILSSSGLYAGSHKIAELQERAQKLQSGQPVSSSGGLTRGGSPLSIYSKDLHCANMGQLPPHSMSPISTSSSTSFTNSIASQHGSLMSSNMGHPGDRKTPPVGARLAHSLPESYSYPLLSAQFPPHFAALGVTPPNMPTVGGPGIPPSGLGGEALPPK